MPTIYDQDLGNSVEKNGVLHPTATPFSSPKYKGGNSRLDTMARLFIPVATKAKADSLEKLTEHKGLARNLITYANPEGFRGAGYVNFLLTSAQEAYAEKVQVVDVLSDNYVAYFFGASPPIFQYSGMVYNTQQDDWRAALTELYQVYLRGTMLARNKTVACLSYDDVVVVGAITNMTQVLSAETQTAAQFSFSMLVKDYYRTTERPFPSYDNTPTLGTNQYSDVFNRIVGGTIIDTTSTRSAINTDIGTGTPQRSVASATAPTTAPVDPLNDARERENALAGSQDGVSTPNQPQQSSYMNTYFHPAGASNG